MKRIIILLSNNEYQEHSNNIGKDKTYGNIMDVLTASIIYDITIHVYRDNGSYYEIIPFTKFKNKPIINLLYVGDIHYMALDRI